MNITEELDKISRTIKDLEIRLSAIRTNIDQIDKEMSVLNPRKVELERNLRFQKKEGIIPIAHEYKKAKAELSRTTARLILITSEHNKAISVSNQIERTITQLKDDHSRLTNLLENNVIQVSFGGDCGKE